MLLAENIVLGLQNSHVTYLLLYGGIQLGRFSDIRALRRTDSVQKIALSTVISSIPFVLGLIFSVQHVHDPRWPHWGADVSVDRLWPALRRRTPGVVDTVLRQAATDTCSATGSSLPTRTLSASPQRHRSEHASHRAARKPTLLTLTALLWI